VRSDNSKEASADTETPLQQRFKAGLQNFLGGLVLLTLPTVPGLMFVGWNTVNDLASKQQQYVFQLSSLAVRLEQDRLEFKERLRSLRKDMSAQFDRINDWKDLTNSNRFRKSDGDDLSDKIESSTSQLSHRLDRLELEQIKHNKEAQKYIAIIERNTAIIFQNQKRAHTH